jgi:mRNA interferase YafQ
MLTIKAYNRFEKEAALAKKRKKDMLKLGEVVRLLQLGSPLPEKFRAHRLNGKWESFLECHIEPDWLLIYRITKTHLELVRTGTHSDLF